MAKFSTSFVDIPVVDSFPVEGSFKEPAGDDLFCTSCGTVTLAFVDRVDRLISGGFLYEACEFSVSLTEVPLVFVDLVDRFSIRGSFPTSATFFGGFGGFLAEVAFRFPVSFIGEGSAGSAFVVVRISRIGTASVFGCDASPDAADFAAERIPTDDCDECVSDIGHDISSPGLDRTESEDSSSSSSSPSIGGISYSILRAVVSLCGLDTLNESFECSFCMLVAIWVNKFPVVVPEMISLFNVVFNAGEGSFKLLLPPSAISTSDDSASISSSAIIPSADAAGLMSCCCDVLSTASCHRISLGNAVWCSSSVCISSSV